MYLQLVPKCTDSAVHMIVCMLYNLLERKGVDVSVVVRCVEDWNLGLQPPTMQLMIQYVYWSLCNTR